MNPHHFFNRYVHTLPMILPSIRPRSVYFLGRNPHPVVFISLSNRPLSTKLFNLIVAYLGLQPRISATSEALAVGRSMAFRTALMKSSFEYIFGFIMCFMLHVVYRCYVLHGT